MTPLRVLTNRASATQLQKCLEWPQPRMHTVLWRMHRISSLAGLWTNPGSFPGQMFAGIYRVSQISVSCKCFDDKSTSRALGQRLHGTDVSYISICKTVWCWINVQQAKTVVKHWKTQLFHVHVMSLWFRPDPGFSIRCIPSYSVIVVNMPYSIKAHQT